MTSHLSMGAGCRGMNPSLTAKHLKTRYETPGIVSEALQAHICVWVVSSVVISST